MPPAFYLASASPRRRELLAQAGFAFDVLRLDADLAVDETPLVGERPHAYVSRLARAKASAGLAHVARHALAQMPVLAADTTVALGNEIFGKPADAHEASTMLARLSGTTHAVFTGVALAAREGVHDIVVTSHVGFRALTTGEIARYVASGEPFDKAGGYGIQGAAAEFVADLSGSFTNVVGLPVQETLELLARQGLAPAMA